jgi:adenylate cyclase
VSSADRRSVDRIRPMGFADAFEIYELRGESGDGHAEDSEFCREWEAVYAAPRNGPLAVAERELARFSQSIPTMGWLATISLR